MTDSMQESNETVVLIPADKPRAWTIQSLSPDSTVQVTLRAHNKIGLSDLSSVIVATPAGIIAVTIIIYGAHILAS